MTWLTSQHTVALQEITTVNSKQCKESNEFTEQLAFNTFLPLLMEIPRTPSIPVEFIRKQSEMVFKWPLAVFMGVQASSWLMQSKVHLLLPLQVL